MNDWSTLVERGIWFGFDILFWKCEPPYLQTLHLIKILGMQALVDK